MVPGDPGVEGERPEGSRRGRLGRPLGIAGRVLVVLAAAVVLIAAGWGYALVRRTDEGIAERQITALVPDDANIVRPDREMAGQPGVGPADGAAPATDPAGEVGGATPDGAAPDAGSPENVLLLGLDTRPPAEASATGGTSQSDVIMIAHLSADRSRVDVLSIPRDTRIDAPTCRQWDYARGTLSDQYFPNTYSYWKITNAYAVGGPQCTVRAVQQLTGLQIHRVIVIGFDGFKTIVDAMGGVQMTFSGPVVDGGVTIIDRAGTQTVDGEQALKLVRARHVAGDPTGDVGRVGRQQQVLTAMLTQAVGSGLLLDPQRLDRTLQVVVANTATDNISVDDLVNLAQSLRGNGSGQVRFHTLPTVADPGSEFLLPASGDDAIFGALVNDRPYPGDPGS